MLQDFDDRLSSTSTASCQETIKFKTELCKYWQDSLECPYGINCFFAHGDKQLLTKDVPKNYRSKPCQNYSNKDYCKYGSRCQFAHPLPEYKLPSFKYYTQIEDIQIGSQKKKHRLPIFKRISSGQYHKVQNESKTIQDQNQ